MNLKHKREKLVKKLTNKDYRDAWVDESVKMLVPYQIQAIRNQRGWSQEILGSKAGMLRNAVSRLESIDYGNLSVNTLLRIAHGLDCGLLVKFVPFNRLVKEFDDVSPKALEVDSFEDDIVFNPKQVNVENKSIASMEAKALSEYAVNLVSQLTDTLSTKLAAQTSIDWDNKNEPIDSDIDYQEQPKTNAIQLHKTVGALNY